MSFKFFLEKSKMREQKNAKMRCMVVAQVKEGINALLQLKYFYCQFVNRAIVPVYLLLYLAKCIQKYFHFDLIAKALAYL